MEYLTIIGGVFVAWLILGERLLPVQAAGAILVFAGVFLSQGPSGRARRRGAAPLAEP